MGGTGDQRAFLLISLPPARFAQRFGMRVGDVAAERTRVEASVAASLRQIEFGRFKQEQPVQGLGKGGV